MILTSVRFCASCGEFPAWCECHVQPADTCHADRDGDCTWAECPQLRDGQPEKSGRHCPLDNPADDE